MHDATFCIAWPSNESARMSYSDTNLVDCLLKRCPDTMVAVCIHFPTSPRRAHFRFFNSDDRIVVVLRVAHSFLAVPTSNVVSFLFVGVDKTLLAPLYKTLSSMFASHLDGKRVLHFTYTS